MSGPILLFSSQAEPTVRLSTASQNVRLNSGSSKTSASSSSSEVAEHFFSVAEIYTLSGLDPHLRTSAFFNCWTRKEAYVKARGEGLSMPLDHFDVSLAPDVQAAMLSNRIDELEKSRWVFHDLQVAPGYASAVVVEWLGSQPHPHVSYFTSS